MKYTREQAEEVLKDWNEFDKNKRGLSIINHAFLDNATEQPKKVSGWYRNKAAGNEKWLTYYDFDNDKTYGFGNNMWIEMNDTYSFDEDYDYLATPQEVERRLIDEAKRRGFVEGVKYKINWFKEDEICEVSDGKWRCNNNSFGYITLCQFGRGWIFNNGKWAEIIEQQVPKVNYDEANKYIYHDELHRTIKKAEKIADKLEKLLSSSCS